MERLWLALAGLSGAAAVAGDALARHVLAGDAERADLLATGARYALIHAAALLAVTALAAMARPERGRARRLFFRVAGWCFVAGLLLFPVSLYLLATGAAPAFGALAPWGGGAFILGWAALALAAAMPRSAG